jgi:hypothetical protein
LTLTPQFACVEIAVSAASAGYDLALSVNLPMPTDFFDDSTARRSTSNALSLALRSVDAVRNMRALVVLLGTFASAGLLLSMAEASLGRGSGFWGALQAGLAFFAAFYGGSAAGFLVMDQSRGVPVREISAALRASVFSAHRLLCVLLVVALVYGLMGGLLMGLMWLSRVSVSGPVIGPVLFGLAVPLGVVGVAWALLAGGAVVVPLMAPAVWSGAGVLATLRQLSALVRKRLLSAALLMAAVSLLTAGVGALVTSLVMASGRVVAELGIAVVGIDVPAKQLMAGLFGYGLRSLGTSGAISAIPPGSAPHAAAALVGGGLVFALVLVLPGLVYLRGTTAVYLALTTHSAAP